jgi:hypothetical protein
MATLDTVPSEISPTMKHFGLADLKDPETRAQVDASFAGIFEDELELVKRKFTTREASVTLLSF